MDWDGSLVRPWRGGLSLGSAPGVPPGIFPAGDLLHYHPDLSGEPTGGAADRQNHRAVRIDRAVRGKLEGFRLVEEVVTDTFREAFRPCDAVRISEGAVAS